MRKIALILVLVVATAMLTGCEGKKRFAPAPDPTPPEPQPIQDEILNSSLSTEWFDFLGENGEWKSEITGEAKNNTGQTVTVWLLGRFYNDQDIMFQESWDLLIDMPAGETWKFEVTTYDEDRALRYTLWVDSLS